MNWFRKIVKTEKFKWIFLSLLTSTLVVTLSGFAISSYFVYEKRLTNQKEIILNDYEKSLTDPSFKQFGIYFYFKDEYNNIYTNENTTAEEAIKVTDGFLLKIVPNSALSESEFVTISAFDLEVVDTNFIKAKVKFSNRYSKQEIIISDVFVSELASIDSLEIQNIATTFKEPEKSEIVN
ncbi:hypothetical protein EI74_0324 [Mycoplasma testudineum]|uniref:Uncharacterized protein n=1 Tax=Mycoplasma testudineum TaxID=244584 RepID=A0A4R6IET0_9MOLU|nr:hypothetical protein [Mycoplasma testudineum]OYD26945.1 hypothetical protein CG473_01230 [Mycoplasma testudineum]TDO20494.1 hypothetical protein EI74_0324 [Mycoplasma testudineum]